MGLGREKCSNWFDAYLKWWVINHVGMDNYFTTLRLLAHLGEHNIHATSVMSKKKNWLNVTLLRKKQLEKKARGYTKQKTFTNKSSKKSQFLDGR